MPIRLFLWTQTSDVDATASGEFVLAPGQVRPARIMLVYDEPPRTEWYQQDPRDANRYVRMLSSLQV